MATPQKVNVNGSADDVSILKQDIAALREEFSKLASDTGEIAKAKVSTATEKAKSLASEAGEVAEDRKEKLEVTIRENPLASLGVAFGAGLLLSFLSRR